jgi:hypothetical protein
MQQIWLNGGTTKTNIQQILIYDETNIYASIISSLQLNTNITGKTQAPALNVYK